MEKKLHSHEEIDNRLPEPKCDLEKRTKLDSEEDVMAEFWDYECDKVGSGCYFLDTHVPTKRFFCQYEELIKIQEETSRTVDDLIRACGGNRVIKDY